jgi:uncharacterized protein YbjT (DUF2867 family)
MNKSGKTICVVGATGQQGHAVVAHLLKNGWSVKALVRNPKKSEAKALEQQGVTLVQGDLNDRPSLDKALKGCYGLFSVQNPLKCGGTDQEIVQGKALADAAKAAGIKHTVYSSVAAADRQTKIPFFESKWNIEKHLKAIQLPCTVVRPVFFMENFETAFPPREQGGNWVLSLPLKLDRPLQMIAVDDIGAIIAQIFDRPEAFHGKTIEIAGDNLSLQQVATLWSRQSGKRITCEEQPIEQVRKINKDLAVMFEWFNKHGYTVDIRALKVEFPFLHSFESWLNSKHGALAGARK